MGGANDGQVPAATQGSWPVSGLGEFKYYFQEPPGGRCSEEEPCPLVVHLHGAGECSPGSGMNMYNKEGTGVFGALPGVEHLAIMSKSPDCWKKMGAFMLFPELPCTATFEGLKNARTTIERFVVPLAKDVLKKDKRTDPERVVITGYSMGGQGCMYAALGSPDLFTFASCSDMMTDPKSFKEFEELAREGAKRTGRRRLQTLVMSQGEKDQFQAQVHDRLLGLGGFLDTEPMRNLSVHYRLYMGVGHESWNEMYYNWPHLMGFLWTGACRSQSAWLSHLHCANDTAGTDCSTMGCCLAAGMTCYSKTNDYAACRRSCKKGMIDQYDALEFQTPWSCGLVTPKVHKKFPHKKAPHELVAREKVPHEKATHENASHENASHV